MTRWRFSSVITVVLGLIFGEWIFYLARLPSVSTHLRSVQASCVVLVALALLMVLWWRDRNSLTLLMKLIFLGAFAMCFAFFCARILDLHLREEKTALEASPVYVTQTYVLKQRSETATINVGFLPASSYYQLTFLYPRELYLNQDGEIQLSNVSISPRFSKSSKDIYFTTSRCSSNNAERSREVN